jgi:large subunit ribosomal protein L6
MSRVGKLPINVPNNIKVDISNNILKITKGSVVKDYDFGDKVSVVFNDNAIKVSPKKDLDKKDVAKFYGLHRNNINNIVSGLISDFTVTLEISGVGFKSSVVKENLFLTLGYSHDIVFSLPKNVVAKIEGNLIILSSDDKHLVGQIAAEIISLRKTEPYKGKGVKIYGKPILRKEGKKK